MKEFDLKANCSKTSGMIPEHPECLNCDQWDHDFGCMAWDSDYCPVLDGSEVFGDD